MKNITIFFNNLFRCKKSKTENVDTVDEIKHPILRTVFKRYGIKGVDFNSSADIPAGTGLASSSAFILLSSSASDVF